MSMYLNFFIVVITLPVKAVKYLEQGCFFNLDTQKLTQTLAFEIFLYEQPWCEK